MITFENVCKTYPGGVQAVKDLSLEVHEGETLVLLGTSGSGKTTTMKMVNRLIEPTGGRILVEGEDVMEKDPIALRRSIGYAIQHIGLFPHMTIGGNIAVVPKLLGWNAADIRERVDKMLSMTGLDPETFRHRFPSELSGGQRQRIGVARALAGDPPIVLMDEPFGALDPITRDQLQDEFRELESEIEKTILFVTHDIFEAVKMGDRIALLDAGELQQLAPPHELVENPANEFVENFLGRHRFQLALLTRSLKVMTDHFKGAEKAPERKEPFLPLHSNLVQALDKFKTHDAKALPVFKGQAFQGTLKKGLLIDAIADVLGETGEDE